ncbi:MAG TPA: hypothetical protein VFT99_11810, partial [Roseiflexaceae bacterium]|nr:hypothetical protein [Roseiflexaceae bacterium]
LGLPFAFAYHFDMGGVQVALDLYRQHFEPSAALDAPYAIVTANVLAADTADEAAYQAAPGQLMMLAIRTGRFAPLTSPEKAARNPDLVLARSMASNRIIGDAGMVVEGLEQLQQMTGADELMVTSVAYGIEARVRSLELLARAWGLHSQ